MECGKVDRVGEVEIGDATKCATNFSNKRKLTNCFIKEKYTRNKIKMTEKERKIKVLGYLVGTEIAKNGMQRNSLDHRMKTTNDRQ